MKIPVLDEYFRRLGDCWKLSLRLILTLGKSIAVRLKLGNLFARCFGKKHAAVYSYFFNLSISFRSYWLLLGPGNILHRLTLLLGVDRSLTGLEVNLSLD